MSSADLTKYLQILTLLGSAVLAGKLYLSGLWRKYPVFFWYFIFRIPNTLWPLLFSNGDGTHLYEELWILTEPISWTFHVLLVVELYSLVVNRYRGIYSLLRWAMYGSVAVAITISVLSLLPKIKPRMNIDTKLLGFWFATERGIDFSLGLFLLLILLFLSRYPVRLNRNILVHAAIYTAFFFGASFSVFLRTFLGSSGTNTTNMILEFISAACVFGWAIFLNPKGEKVQASFNMLNPRQEEAALRQLEFLNATLLRASRK